MIINDIDNGNAFEWGNTSEDLWKMLQNGDSF